MKKFIPKEKMGKKARRELDLSKRQIWGINPVSRSSKNPKAYTREKIHQWDKDGGFSYGKVQDSYCLFI